MSGSVGAIQRALRSDIVKIAALAVAYYLGGRLALAFLIQPENYAAIWPPSGIALAGLLLIPKRRFLAGLLAVLAANLVLNLGAEQPARLCTGFLLAEAVEATLAVYLMRRKMKGTVSLGTLRDAQTLLAGPVCVCCSLSAVVGATAISSAGQASFWITWQHWFVADALGMLVFVPLMLNTGRLLAEYSRQPIAWRSWGVTMLLTAVVAMAIGVFWFDAPVDLLRIRRPYVLFPMLFWIAFRFPATFASAALSLIAGIAVFATSAGHGPFAFSGTPQAFQMLEVQIFMCVLAAMTLIVSAVHAERIKTESELHAHVGILEETQILFEEQAIKLHMQNQELQFAQQRAEDANRSKGEFLANMSHEIRTPMTAILGFADVLRDQVQEPAAIAAAETIRRNGRHLLEIINDVLDLSKIESGRLIVESIPCSLNEIIEDVTSLMAGRAEAKGIALRVVWMPPTPARILSDPTRIRQILINLVGNAIKFTETGEVRIVIHSLMDAETEPTLQIDVHDTGIGMTPDQVGQLFQPFTQADASTTRRFGGTGLGLSISKRLAEILGGTITVTSVPRQGSIFSLWLPTGHLTAEQLAPANAAAPTRVKTSTATAVPKLCCHVLLAEDSVDNQRLISHILRKAGAEVTIADNGAIAVDMALEPTAAGHRPFDIILMDMQMPVLDGYGATEELRAQGFRRPIIALTANAMAADRTRCLAAGCDDYASKPIDRKQLLSLIDKHTRERSTTDESSGSQLPAEEAVA